MLKLHRSCKNVIRNCLQHRNLTAYNSNSSNNVIISAYLFYAHMHPIGPKVTWRACANLQEMCTCKYAPYKEGARAPVCSVKRAR